MVVFTCNRCGDSVKKVKVDEHLFMACKKKHAGPASLCCIDCLKDFDEKTYVAHNSCLTEMERYSAPGYIGKPSSNKGLKKQTSWIDCLRCVSTSKNLLLTKPQRDLLAAISKHDNVPRKKSKFDNFVKSMNYRCNPTLVTSIFDLIEKEFTAMKLRDEKGDVEKCETETKMEPKREETDSRPMADKKSKKSKKEKTDREERELVENFNAIELQPAAKAEKKKKRKRGQSESFENGTEKEENVLEEGNSNLVKIEEESVKEEVGNFELVGKKKKNKKMKEATREGVEVDGGDDANHDQEVASRGGNAADEEIRNVFESKERGNKKKRIRMKSENEFGSGGFVIDGNESPEAKREISKKKSKKLKVRDENLGKIPEARVLEIVSPTETSEISPKNSTDISRDKSEKTQISPPEDSENLDRNFSSKLTRKELKKMKKLMKYEAELEKANVEVARGDEENEEEEVAGKKGNKKKRKGADNEEAALKRKRQFSENGDVPAKKSAKDEEFEIAPNENMEIVEQADNQRFDWERTITAILTKAGGREIPLKRLGKKVAQEYQAKVADFRTFEDLMTKFHKKISKIRRVKIVKDKVTLRE